MLHVRDVTIGRGGVPLLSGMSFDVAKGHALILKGPNGVGKTSALRSLAGLQPLWAGEVTPGPEAVAYAGHADAVKPTLRVEEILAFWARIYGTRDFGAAVAAFDLDPLMGRFGGQLSAGQKRRVGLARLLLSERSVWCLDEPLVALDVAAVSLVISVLDAHLSGGGVALISTHQPLDLAAPELDLGQYRAKATIDESCT